jgi:hypothetical protein
MAELDLNFRLTDFSQHPLLIGNVRFDRIGDEKVRTPPGCLSQIRQRLLELGFRRMLRVALGVFGMNTSYYANLETRPKRSNSNWDFSYVSLSASSAMPIFDSR